MSTGFFLVVMGIGAALNAAWIDMRFPGLAPRELRFAVVHLLASSVLVKTAIPIAFGATPDTPTSAVLTVLGVAFPVLGYVFLSGFWLLKVARGMLADNLR